MAQGICSTLHLDTHLDNALLGLGSRSPASLGIALDAAHPRLDQQRALPLSLLHLRLLVSVRLPNAAEEHLDGCVVYLLPTVEAAALAERADGVREGVVEIVEEHLVPAVTSTEHKGHDGVEHGPSAVRVVGQEPVPWE